MVGRVFAQNGVSTEYGPWEIRLRSRSWTAGPWGSIMVT